MKIYNILFGILIVLAIVEASSMTPYLQRCNFNSICEGLEDSETCPEDCDPIEDKEGDLEVESVIDTPMQDTNLKRSQIILKEEKPFSSKSVFSISFVVFFLILVVLLYSWIHNKKIVKKISHTKKDNKFDFYQKPESRI